MVNFFSQKAALNSGSSLVMKTRLASTLAANLKPSTAAAVSASSSQQPSLPPRKVPSNKVCQNPSLFALSPVPLHQPLFQQTESFPFPNRSWKVVRHHPTDLQQALALVVTTQTTSLSTSVKLQPDQLLVRVLASSVSPLDIELTRGSSGSVVHSIRQQSLFSAGSSLFSSQKLPLTPGQDFVGAIVARGRAVAQYKPGDLVWGTVPPTELGGAHADYVVTTDNSIAHKPRNLSNVEAASLPYVGLTAWAAISNFGQLSAQSAYKKKVLVLGGNEAVGSFAIQLLHYWGAEVTATTTTSSGSADWLKALIGGGESLSASEFPIANYPDLEHLLVSDSAGANKPFDFILDASTSATAARRNYQLLAAQHWQNQSTSPKSAGVLHSKTLYVTLTSPLFGSDSSSLETAAAAGKVAGDQQPVGTVADTINDSLSSVGGGPGGLPFRWAYYLPNPKALLHITDLVERGAIRPLTSTVYEFDRALEAYQLLLSAAETTTADSNAGSSINGKVVLSNL